MSLVFSGTWTNLQNRLHNHRNDLCMVMFIACIVLRGRACGFASIVVFLGLMKWPKYSISSSTADCFFRSTILSEQIKGIKLSVTGFWGMQWSVKISQCHVSKVMRISIWLKTKIRSLDLRTCSVRLETGRVWMSLYWSWYEVRVVSLHLVGSLSRLTIAWVRAWGRKYSEHSEWVDWFRHASNWMTFFDIQSNKLPAVNTELVWLVFLWSKRYWWSQIWLCWIKNDDAQFLFYFSFFQFTYLGSLQRAANFIGEE